MNQDFYRGKSLNAYEYLGCHLTDTGALFRVFAPAAAKITVTGDFNNWNETSLQKVYDGNFWECHMDGSDRWKLQFIQSKG